MCAMWENQHCLGLLTVEFVARPHVCHIGLQIRVEGGDLLPHATLPLGSGWQARFLKHHRAMNLLILLNSMN